MLGVDNDYQERIAEKNDELARLKQRITELEDDLESKEVVRHLLRLFQGFLSYVQQHNQQLDTQLAQIREVGDQHKRDFEV